MATAKLEKLSEDFLHCSLCLESFRDPRSLGCLHTFCCPCLVSYAQSLAAGPGARLPCPLCRDKTTLPTAEGVTGLKSNYFVKNLQEFVGRAVEVDLCGLCDSGDVGVSRCVECESVLCQQCTDMHSTVKMYKKHTVFPIKDSETTRNTTDDICEKHNEILQYFCLDPKCKQPLCGKCQIEHANHKIIDMKRQHEACKLKLSTSLAQMTGIKLKEMNTLKALTENKKNIATEKLKVKEDIERHVGEIIQQIKTEGDKVIDFAFKLLDEKEVKATEKMGEVKGHLASVLHIVHFIGQLLGHGSMVDVVSLSQVVFERVEEVAKRCGQRDEVDLLKDNVQFYPGSKTSSALQEMIGRIQDMDIEILEDTDMNDIQIPQLLEKPFLKRTFPCKVPGDQKDPKITLMYGGPEGDIACYDCNNSCLKVFNKFGTLKWFSKYKSLPSSPLDLEWNSALNAYILEYKNTFAKVKTWGLVEMISDGFLAERNVQISIILEKQKNGPDFIKVWAPELNPKSDECSHSFHVSSSCSVAKISPSGEIIAGSKDERCIWKFDQEGNLLWHKLCEIEGSAYLPKHVYFDRYGYIWVTFYDLLAVIILNKDGVYLQKIHVSNQLTSNIAFSSNDEMILRCNEGDPSVYQYLA